MPEDQARGRVREVLGFIGLGDYIDRLPSELSGGQRRRVAIARAMAAKPSLLLFDDPTTGLDPIIATTVDDEIIKLRDLEHVTSIVVTHQSAMRLRGLARGHAGRRAPADSGGGGSRRESTPGSWCSTTAGSRSKGRRRSCARRGTTT